MKFRKSFLIKCFMLSILVTPLLGVNALAQNQYPSKPIKLLVPFPPGGSTDIFARMLGDAFTQMWGQPVIIENKPGASGQIAVDMLMKAPADGYTLFMGHIGTLAVSPALYPNLSYDPIKDFVPISVVAGVPNVMVVNAEVAKSRNINTVADFVAYAKANPAKLNFGSGGNGSAGHLAGEMFKRAAGIFAVHIPYNGGNPAQLALLSGQVDFNFDNLATAAANIKAGRLKALAVTTAQRSNALPDIPSMSETLKDFSIDTWWGLVAPAATPRDVVDRLNKAFVAALQAPETKTRFAQLMAEPVGNTPEQFGAFMKKELTRYESVVKASGARVD